VGVQVVTPFKRLGRVMCAAVSGGTVATVVHRGLYQQLSEAHAALRKWCAEHRYALAGPCEDVCIFDTMMCVLIRGFLRAIRGMSESKAIDFMHFHEVFIGKQREFGRNSTMKSQ
jgi:hypothetical protein